MPVPAFLLFAVVCWAVAGGMIALHGHTLAALDAAQAWPTQSCTIERIATRDGALEVDYRYELGGRSIAGWELDLVPGRLGTDDAFEEALAARLEVGTTTPCWADPEDPENVVLDRRHGADSVDNLLLLAFPFGLAGTAFGYALLMGLLGALASPRETRPIAPAPRAAGLLARGAFIVRRGATRDLAWAFLTGFVLLFVMFDGPGHLGDLLGDEGRRLEGDVTSVRPLRGHELGRTVYEIRFRFEADGETHDGVSRRRGSAPEVGERVALRFDPARPDAATLVDARRREIPFPIVAGIAAVAALLASGLALGLAFAISRQRLLATGVPATPQDGRAFDADGATIAIDPRARRNATGDPETWVVLHDPVHPARHLVLGAEERALLEGGAAAGRVLVLGLVVPVACIAAIAWLLFGVDPAL